MYLPLSICATKAHAYEMNWLWSSSGNNFSGNNNVIILTGGRNPRIYEMKGVLFKPLFTSFSEDSRLLFRKWQQANVPSTVVAVQTEPKSSEKDGNRLSAEEWYQLPQQICLHFSGQVLFPSFLFDLCEETRIMWMFAFCMHIRTKIQTQTLQSHVCKMTCFLLPQWH